jgi:hypothetical protein
MDLLHPLGGKTPQVILRGREGSDFLEEIKSINQDLDVCFVLLKRFLFASPGAASTATRFDELHKAHAGRMALMVIQSGHQGFSKSRTLKPRGLEMKTGASQDFGGSRQD